jgi:cell division protein FtsB
MLEKTDIAEQGFNQLVNSELEKLRLEVMNLKKQIEYLKSDLRHYELEATRNL